MRFFVAGNNQTVSRQLQEILSRHGQDCEIVSLTPASAAAEKLGRAQADVLLVVLSPDPQAGFALLHENRSGTLQRVLAVGPATDPRLRIAALREGADQFLDEAELAIEMEALLRRAAPSSGPVPKFSGKLLSVLAPSGGSGSSTLSVNLATALAKEHGRCLLVDLNLGAGDVAALLDLKPAHTLADLCRQTSRMDRAMFQRCLVQHDSGVSLLSPPRSFADIAHVTTQGVADALKLARGLFPYVVVDLDDSFHSEQTHTLRQSEIILLVMRLEFTSLRNTQRTLEHLRQMQIHADRVRLVVNRYGQPQELPASRAEEALNIKIAYYIPDDPKTINRANNHGVPAVLDAPAAKVSKSVLQLAASVNGQPKAP